MDEICITISKNFEEIHTLLESIQLVDISEVRIFILELTFAQKTEKVLIYKGFGTTQQALSGLENVRGGILEVEE